jgi:hypothetical protein
VVREENERLAVDEGQLRKELANREIAANKLKQELPAPTSAPAREPAAAPREAEVASGPRSDASVNGNLNELAKSTTERETSSFGEKAVTAVGAVADGASVRYRQVAAVAKDSDAVSRRQKVSTLSADTPAPATSPAPVLAAFEVKRNGRDLRIVDGDGSVYSGIVESANEISSAGKPSASGALQDKKADEAMLGDSFRVSGTNQSLGRNIVFSGKFMAVTNSGEPGTNSGDFGFALGAPVLKTQTAIPIIQGTVSVDDTQKMEIRAVPTP